MTPDSVQLQPFPDWLCAQLALSLRLWPLGQQRRVALRLRVLAATASGMQVVAAGEAAAGATKSGGAQARRTRYDE
jgi:hypothetical protein